MENVAINVRKNFTMDKYFSQVKIVTPNNISKLLETSARSVISSAEVVNNYLMVSGKIVANAVYLTDENIIENTETTLEFVEKQKITFVLSEISACDNLEIQSTSVSTSEVMLSLSHSTEVAGIYRYLVGDSEKQNEDLVLNKKTINALNFKQSNEETFVVAEEVETNLSGVKILNANSDVIVTNVVSSVDKVIVDGKVKINALYLEENNLGEIVKEFEFKQEIAMKNALPGMHAEVALSHLNTSIVEQPKEDKNLFAFVIDLSAKAYVFESIEVQTFDDLFSLKNELVPIYEIAEFEQDDGFEFDNDTVLTQTDISLQGDFDDIVGVYQPVVKITEVTDLGDKLNVNAEIHTLAVYKTQTSIQKLELKFDTHFESDKEISKKIKAVSASASVSAFKVKAGKDLESAFAVEYKFEYKKESAEKFVKSFEEKQEKVNTDAGVKVYVTRENQTIFDVAKVLNVKPELIKSQMEVDDIFEAGQKVFVYCPLNLA